MNTPPNVTRIWAGQLLAWEAANLSPEAANLSPNDASIDEAVRVVEKLRVSMTQFVGPDGFAAVMRRALVLARADFPSLQTANVTAAGRLEGRDACADGDNGAGAAIAIAGHLLGLLVTFIGVSLTRRMVRNAWPGVPLDK